VPEWISEISAFAVFLAIAAVGFVFLLISLVFGEIFDLFADGGMDHDLGHGGPGFFSSRVISVFVTAFGGFGAIAIHYGLSVLPASGIGFGSGVAFATLIYLFARFLYGQQATTQLSSADVVGKTGRVVVAIPASGIGQVRCQVGDEVIDKIARSQGGEAIPENTIVRIQEVLGEVVIVRRPD
jgi:membrane protein implicated in regulation of membrane protease activity